jgi:hypothetical protein
VICCLPKLLLSQDFFSLQLNVISADTESADKAPGLSRWAQEGAGEAFWRRWWHVSWDSEDFRVRQERRVTG